MARVEVKMWADETRKHASKIVIRPETPEELAMLRAHDAHVGSDQMTDGQLFYEVVWTWRRVHQNRSRVRERNDRRRLAEQDALSV